MKGVKNEQSEDFLFWVFGIVSHDGARCMGTKEI